MGKGAPIRWIENKAIGSYLQGRGIEVGALWRRFPVPRRVRVWYVDRGQDEYLKSHYGEVATPLVRPDVVADAAKLPFARGSLQFIIASHLLEHMPFPVTALRHWYDILAPGGVLVLKIPDKRYTFDARRQRTPLEHLLAEESNPSSFDKRAHYRDWAENVLKLSPGSKDCVQETERLMEMDYSIHFHVWTEQDISELIEHTRSVIALNWKPVVFLGARFYRKECTIVLQKGRP